VLLFQGDSITDVDRDRKNSNSDDPQALGSGYPLLISSALLSETDDGQWRCYNRGVGGNKVPDLQARWTSDTIALQPDILSILIGVNDYWHMRRGKYAGTAVDFEAQYATLLAETRRARPRIRIVILEPFVGRGGAVDDSWFPAFDERRAIAARVASRAGATFVPLQAVFDRLGARTRPTDWLEDGVHPTLAGHAVIAAQWKAAVGL